MIRNVFMCRNHQALHIPFCDLSTFFTNELGKKPCWVIRMMSIPSDTHLTALITSVVLEKCILKDKGADKK